MISKITIDPEKCNGCMLCEQICMLGNVEQGPEGKARPAEGLTCFTCGHCIAVCPTGALTRSDFDTASFELLDESARPSFDQLLKFLKMRRSRREFKDDPVPREVAHKLLLAAVEAPSSINNQSVLYTVITDRAVLKRISEVCANYMRSMKRMMENPFGRLIFRIMAGAGYEDLKQFVPLIDMMLRMQDSGKDMILYDAPCLILLHAPKSDLMAAEDAIFNAENILLAVETLGLGACVIGFVTDPANRGKEIKQLVGMPADHKVFSSIAVGYPKFKYAHSVPKNPPKVKYVEAP